MISNVQISNFHKLLFLSITRVTLQASSDTKYILNLTTIYYNRIVIITCYCYCTLFIKHILKTGVKRNETNSLRGSAQSQMTVLCSFFLGWY